GGPRLPLGHSRPDADRDPILRVVEPDAPAEEHVAAALVDFAAEGAGPGRCVLRHRALAWPTGGDAGPIARPHRSSAGARPRRRAVAADTVTGASRSATPGRAPRRRPVLPQPGFYGRRGPPSSHLAAGDWATPSFDYTSTTAH